MNYKHFMTMRDLREAKAQGYITLEIRLSTRGQEMSYTFKKENGSVMYYPRLVDIDVKEDPSLMQTITL